MTALFRMVAARASRSALAIVNMLIFVVIFSILAGVTLALVSSHSRIMESSIRRTKAYYVAEAGHVARFESLRRGLPFSNPAVEWSFNPSTGAPSGNKTATVTYVSPNITSTCNYTVNW